MLTFLESTDSNQWRLMCAGYYPVEWRDFYMGDMFCSLTYSMGVSHRFDSYA
jgi:hypothetical protein